MQTEVVGSRLPSGARGQTSREGFKPTTGGAFVKTGRPLPQQLVGEFPEMDSDLRDYPRMLYGPDFYEAQQFVKEFVLEGGTPRETAAQMRKYEKAQQTMKKAVIVVHTPEDEEQYLAEGWRSNPVDHAVANGAEDPRIPTGLEGRRAAEQQRLSTEEEVLALRRRYAELTGQTLDESFAAPLATAAEPAAPRASKASRKRTPKQTVAAAAPAA